MRSSPRATSSSAASVATPGGSGRVIEHARLVIGADGRHSILAKAVEPEQYNEHRSTPGDVLRLLEQPSGRGALRRRSAPSSAGAGAAARTHDGLTRGRPSVGRSRSSTRTAETSRATSSKTVQLSPAFAEPRAWRRGRESKSLWLSRFARIFSASRSVPAGHWLATPGTTRTRLPRWASTTHSATRSSLPARWTEISLRAKFLRGGDGQLPARTAIVRRAPSTSSLTNSHSSGHHHPSCSSCSELSMETRMRWTPS